jgi:Na+/H+ antiporter NhaC
MTIVIITLVIMLTIIILLFYGLKKWKSLIVTQDESEEDNLELPIEDSRSHIPIWILLIGIFIVTFIAYFFE